MRILHIAQHHERLGGAEVHRENVIEGLDERGHTNAFFGGSESQELRTEQRRVLKRPAWDADKLIADRRLQRELWSFIRSFRPDVVHVHQAPYFPVDLHAQLARLGLPIVQTAYDYGLVCTNSWGVLGDGTPCAGGPGSKCFDNGCSANYPFTPATVMIAQTKLELLRDTVDVLVCPTEHMSEMLRAHGFKRVRKLPYFPAAANADGSSSRALDAPPIGSRRDGSLLVVARLEREKGVDRAIAAFALLRAEVPEATLDIVGDGPERRRLEAQAQALDLGDSARFLGRLSTDESTRRMQRARALLIPSVWLEALPLISFDAHATGTPIVAHAIGGLPEGVKHGVDGHLVEIGDSAGFARALKRVLTDDIHWQSLSNAARNRDVDCTRDAYLQGLEAAYLEAQLEHSGVEESALPGSDQQRVLHEMVQRQHHLEHEIAMLKSGVLGRFVRVREKLKARLRAALAKRRGTRPADNEPGSALEAFGHDAEAMPKSGASKPSSGDDRAAV